MESRRFLAVQEHGVTYVRANPAAPFTTGEKARRLAMVVTATLAIASVCLVLAGYGTGARAEHRRSGDPGLWARQ